MTIKQQGGIFGRNPTFNNVDVEGTLTVSGEPISDFGTMAQQDATSVNIDGGAIDGVTLGTTSAVTEANINNETISGNTSSVVFNSNSAGMLFSGGADATKYSGIVFRGANSWNTFLGRIPDGAADPLVIGNDAISSFGSICTFGANDVTINRGNLVIGTSGNGIDFSATAGTGTSELFDDYEEGSVSQPLEIGGSNQVDYYTNASQYTKVGNVVTYVVSFDLYNRDLIGTGALKINLPFASFSGTGGQPKIIEEVVYRSASTKAGSPTTSVGAYNLGSGSSYAELYTDNTLGTAISAPDTSERYLFNFVITYRSA